MEPSDTQRALKIIDDAHGLSPSELDAYLDDVCGADTPLRREVLSILEFSDEKIVFPAVAHEGSVPDIPGASTSETRYVLGEEIARGGIGVIHRAFDRTVGRDVAVKVLRSEAERNQDVVRRFLQEAQIGGRLQHPGLPPVYEIGRLSDGRPFIAMKLVKGATLEKLLAQRQDAVENRAEFLSIFQRVCQAIAFAHDRGVIHRDLKPANVMVGEFGEVQVMDWGIAKVVAHEAQSDTCLGDVPPAKGGQSGPESRDRYATKNGIYTDFDTDHGALHTRIGQVLGTPSYMAPEQAIGRSGKATDVFALGGILCEILTGAPPYQAASSTVRLDQAIHGEIQAAHQRLRESGEEQELVQLAIKCLAPVVDQRPLDANDVERRITAYLQSAQERIRQAEIDGEKAHLMAREQRKRWRLTVAAVGVALALIVGGGLFYQRLQNRHSLEVLGVEQREREQAEDVGYWSTIQAAFGAYNTGQYHRAYNILQMSPPRLRDWEWSYLHAQIDDSVWDYGLSGERVHCALFQHGGRKIALITHAGIIKIIDRETNKLVHEPTKTDGKPVAVNAGGTRLLVRRPKTYDLWEIGSGRLVRSFPSYASSVSADALPLKFKYPTDDRYAISPDGDWVAVVGAVDYTKVHLYRVAKSKPVHSFDCEWGYGCGFSEDGKWFIRSHAGKIHFWDLETDQVARAPIEVKQGKKPIVNRDGTILATEVFSRLEAWDLATGESRSLAQTPLGNFAFDASGSRLVVANPNASLQIWDPRTGEQSRTFGVSFANVSRIGSYSWHGSEFLVASTHDGDGQIRIWPQGQTGSLVLEGHTNDIYPVAMNRDGSIIASGSWDGTARIWNGETKQQLFKFTHPVDVQALALDPDGRRLVTVTQDREMRLWDAETGKLMLTKRHYDGFDFNPAFLFSSDGTTILCTAMNKIHRLNAKTLEIEHVLNDGGRIDAIATDTTESLIASISFTPDTVTFSLSLRDPESFHKLRSIRLPSEALSVALSPDGGLAAVGFKDGSVGVWKTHNLRELWLEMGHSGEVFDVLFESDGSRLFSAGRDGRIRIRDPNTGEDFGELLGHDDYVMALAIAGDGKRLVSGSGDDTVRIWDSKPRAPSGARAGQ